MKNSLAYVIFKDKNQPFLQLFWGRTITEIGEKLCPFQCPNIFVYYIDFGQYECLTTTSIALIFSSHVHVRK